MANTATPWNVTPETQALVENAFGKGAEVKVITGVRNSRIGIKLGKEWVVHTSVLLPDETPDSVARRDAQFALAAKK